MNTMSAILVGVTFAAPVLVTMWQRCRTPPELRGAWWARFENEFRVYTNRAPNVAHEDGRRSRDKNSPPR